MRKTKAMLFAAIMTFGVILTGCGSKSEYTRNSNYTYGTLNGNNIEAVYDLVGEKEVCSIVDFSEDTSKGYRSRLRVTVSETASGGVVAWGEGMYVYSQNKNDAYGVRIALSSELEHQRQNK